MFRPWPLHNTDIQIMRGLDTKFQTLVTRKNGDDQEVCKVF